MLEEEDHTFKLKKRTIKRIWVGMLGIDSNNIVWRVEPELQQVLQVYELVFSEPNGLPPPQSHDHRIQL